jgi:carbonic anhydrase
MNNQQPNIEPALERNRAFAAAGGHEGAVVFPNLRLFVITCLDPRVEPAHFLGLDLSDAIVVRNVGGRVTPEVINDVAFIGQLAENALPDGPLFEAAVIHHTQCGSGALADDTFRHRYAERIGAEESTLREHAVLDPRGDRHPRRRATPICAFDLRAGRSVRACLRRGHWPGGDRRPRQRLRSSKQEASPIAPNRD